MNAGRFEFPDSKRCGALRRRRSRSLKASTTREIRSCFRLANATVNQFSAPARSAFSEIRLFDETDRITTRCGIDCCP